jgi:hypothetical protein
MIRVRKRTRTEVAANHEALLTASVAELRLPQRIVNYLEEAGYHTVGQCLAATPDQLLAIPLFGRGLLRQLQECIREVLRTGRLPEAGEDEPSRAPAPTPEEIRDRCRAIRAGWPVNDPRQRKGVVPLVPRPVRIAFDEPRQQGGRLR